MVSSLSFVIRYLRFTIFMAVYGSDAAFNLIIFSVDTYLLTGVGTYKRRRFLIIFFSVLL